MFILDPTIEPSIEIIGSNLNQVANFTSTTGEAYIRIFGNELNSNVAYSFGCSNIDENTPTFVIGEIVADPFGVAPDIVIQNHQVSIGRNNAQSGYKFTVEGSGYFTSNIYASNLTPSAYIDTTIADNISSGTLAVARFPESGAAAGIYGSSNSVPRIIVDSKGRITYVENVATCNLTGFADVVYTGDYNSLSNTTFYLSLSNAVYTAGNVGIGTTNPGYPLQVVGEVYATSFTGIGSNLSLLNASSITSGNLANARLPLAFSVSTSSPSLTIDAGGNVGIGTATPESRLHVNGDIYASGTLTARDLVVFGDTTVLNTTSSNTEQMVITNAGTGPALKVVQSGVNTVAEFFDSDVVGGIPSLIIANGGNVGLGTQTPLRTLHVHGDVLATGSIDAATLAGDGASLSNLNASYITTGTLNNARLPSAISVATFSGDGASLSNLNASYVTTGTLNNARLPSAISVATFSGDGAALSNLNASYVTTGTLNNARLPSAISVATFSGDGAALSNLNASYITTGTLNNARLPAAIAVSTLAGDGASLSNLNASYITSGTIDNARLPSSISVTSFSGDGSLLSNLNATNLAFGTIANARLPPVFSIQTLTPTITVASDGNVGIGTTQPIGALQVSGMFNTGTGFLQSISANRAVNVVGTESIVSIIRYGGQDPAMELKRYNVAGTTLQSYWDMYTTNDDDLRIRRRTAGTTTEDALVVDTNKNVGIGTVTPTEKLHVQGNSYVQGTMFTSNISGNAYSLSNINASYLSTGTVSNARLPPAFSINTATQTFTIDASANVGIGTASPLTKLHLEGGLRVNNSGTGPIAQFYDTDVSTTVPRVIIANNGNIGIGTTTPTYVLQVENDVYFNHVFTTEVTMTSDSNLKTNVRTIENAVDIVDQLRGVHFEWKENARKSVGMIAQEVEAILPELVHDDANGYKSISYGNMIGVLIEAVKEQQAQIHELQKIVQTLLPSRQ